MKSVKEYKRELLAKFRAWLADYIKRHDFSQAEAAARLGVTAATINMILKGTRGLSDDLMKKMLLLSGETLPFELGAGNQVFSSSPQERALMENDAVSQPLSDGEMSERGFFTVPFSNNMKLAAGEGGRIPITEDAESSVIVVHGPSIKRRSAKNLQAFRVGGPSMEPLIADGGIVLADLGRNDIRHIKDGRIYVLCWDLEEGECACKYLRWFEKGKIVSIESEDRFFRPVLKRLDEIVLIGQVFWAWREFPD